MDTYALHDLGALLAGNPYPGRGIVVGKSADGRHAAVAYFIMGRSENSRNRIFAATEDGIRTQAFDPAKVKDPSLIIYHPVRRLENRLIVTNGDQTDTVRDGLLSGESFSQALSRRCFEPDGPNWTPRVSAMLTFAGGDFTYEMSMQPLHLQLSRSLRRGPLPPHLCHRRQPRHPHLPGRAGAGGHRQRPRGLCRPGVGEPQCRQ